MQSKNAWPWLVVGNLIPFSHGRPNTQQMGDPQRTSNSSVPGSEVGERPPPCCLPNMSGCRWPRIRIPAVLPCPETLWNGHWNPALPSPASRPLWSAEGDSRMLPTPKLISPALSSMVWVLLIWSLGRGGKGELVGPRQQGMGAGAEDPP